MKTVKITATVLASGETIKSKDKNALLATMHWIHNRKNPDLLGSIFEYYMATKWTI